MTFPYTGWVLTSGFKPAQVTVVSKKQYSFGDAWLETETGKNYAKEKVHLTKEEAIAHGHIELFKQQAAVDKKQTNIHKRRAALEKAAGEAKP